MYILLKHVLILGMYPTPFKLFKTIIHELKQQFQAGDPENAELFGTSLLKQKIFYPNLFDFMIIFIYRILFKILVYCDSSGLK